MRALVVAVAAALALLGWVLWPSATSADYRPAEATVVQGSQCGGTDRHDVVRLDLGGREVEAELQGCGHKPGEVIEVEVPDPIDVADGATPMVRLAGTGVPPERTAAKRLAAVLAVSSGAGGAILAWRLRDRQLR